LSKPLFPVCGPERLSRGPPLREPAALQAAAGQGVALASTAFLADDLLTGRLVKPFAEPAVRGLYGFFIVCPEATADREKVVMFRDWPLAEAVQDS
jgi:LysR family glycine cleavage system transcriptional activator